LGGVGEEGRGMREAWLGVPLLEQRGSGWLGGMQRGAQVMRLLGGMQIMRLLEGLGGLELRGIGVEGGGVGGIGVE